MPLTTLLFATSLLVLAVFFAIKEREVYSGSSTFITRIFAYLSPSAERVWNAVYSFVISRVTASIHAGGEHLRHIIGRLGVTLRYLVVVLADKMIKSVKGERLLSMRGGASVYLKNLGDGGTGMSSDRETNAK